MINAAGKQAIKNGGAPVTNSFAEQAKPPAITPLECASMGRSGKDGLCLAVFAAGNEWCRHPPLGWKPNANVIAPQSPPSRAPCLPVLAWLRGQGGDGRLIRGFGGVTVDEVP